MHSRNFGCDKTIRPSVRTSSFHASGSEISQLPARGPTHIQSVFNLLWSTSHGQLTAVKKGIR